MSCDHRRCHPYCHILFDVARQHCLPLIRLFCVRFNCQYKIEHDEVQQEKTIEIILCTVNVLFVLFSSQTRHRLNWTFEFIYGQNTRSNELEDERE
jgi:hypothetical protein